MPPLVSVLSTCSSMLCANSLKISAVFPLGLIAGLVAHRAVRAWWLSRYHRYRIAFIREKMLRHEMASLLNRHGVSVVPKDLGSYGGVHFYTSTTPFCHASSSTELLEAPLNHLLADVDTGLPMWIRMPATLVDHIGHPLMESLFCTYAALFDARVSGDIYLLVDAWNVMAAMLHHKMLAIIGLDREVVANGGVGELSGDWDATLSTAAVLNHRYNVFKHPCVMALMEKDNGDVRGANGIVSVGRRERGAATLLVLDLSSDLVSRVSALARARTSIIPALSQVAAIVRRTCSVGRLVGLGTMIASIRFALSVGISDVHWEDETYLNRFFANMQASASSEQRVCYTGVHAWQQVGQQFIGSLLLGVVQMLSRVLGNLSIYVVGSMVLSLTEETVASMLAGSVESEVVMAVAAQDMPYILGDRLRQVLSALVCLRMFSEQVVDSVERQVRGLYALRAGVPFPLVVVAFCVLQQAQRFLTTQYTMANLVVDNLGTFYLSDVVKGSTTSSQLQSLISSSGFTCTTHNCLVDDASVPDSMGVRRTFASVDPLFLSAAFPQEDAGPAERFSFPSEHAPSPSYRGHRDPVILHQLVETAIGSSGASRCAESGLSALLSVATECGTTSFPCWCLLGSVVEWPVSVDSLSALQSLNTSATRCYERYEESAAHATWAQVCESLHQAAVLIGRDLRARDKRNSLRRTEPVEQREGGNTTLEHQHHRQPNDGSSFKFGSNDVPLPPITIALTKDRRVTGTLRACGKELDVVKACMVSEAYEHRVSKNSVSSFLQTHWVDIYISSVQDFLMRAVGNFFYGDAFLELSKSSRGMSDIRSASRRVQEFVSPTVHTAPHYDHHSGKKGLEQLYRLDETAHRAVKQSEIARNALPFSTLNNALAIRSACIDRPISSAMLAAAEQDLMAASTDLSRSMLAFSVDFINVSKSFGHKKVLSNVSFSVKRGEFVGIVGVSGAGKTTILNLLLRMFDPDEGKILINGRDIADFPVRMLRRRIAYVCQDFKENGFFPTSTITENIALGDLSREDMEASINEALLQADAKYFVESKPLKKKTLPDDKIFSGGEIQRLVIARAMMRRPQRTGLLVLDEATSAVDGATEKLIVANMLGGRRHMECKPSDRITCVAVAHRLATLTAADKILVLHDGGIVEEGSWQSLARDASSRFHQLLLLQTVRGEVLDFTAGPTDDMASTSRTASDDVVRCMENSSAPADCARYPTDGEMAPASVPDDRTIEVLQSIVTDPAGIDADVVARATRILACISGSSPASTSSAKPVLAH